MPHVSRPVTHTEHFAVVLCYSRVSWVRSRRNLAVTFQSFLVSDMLGESCSQCVIKSA